MAKNVYGIIPRMVVVIGGTPVLATTANITLTNKAEPSTASVEIPMDNIDSSIFTVKGKYYDIQIWCGYLDERDKDTTWEYAVANKRYENSTTMFKRFDGFVDQPEWCIGDERILKLSCKDAAGLLGDGKFSEKREGGQASAKSVIAAINSSIKGIKIVFEGPDYDMGTKDSKGEKTVYNIAGKNYWDVIKDVAEKGNLNIKKDHTTITIGKQEQWKRKWTMLMTNTTDDKKDWTNFKKLNIRYGKSGQRCKEAILVLVHCHTPVKKKGKSRSVVGKYPAGAKDWNGDENTEVIRRIMKYPLTQAEANAKAKNVAEEYLRGFVTGDVDVPFASPEMLPDEGIAFHSDKNYGLEFLADKVFRIDSINETFSANGYSQTIEFESNPRFEQIERTAPKNIDTKPSTKRQFPARD